MSAKPLDRKFYLKQVRLECLQGGDADQNGSGPDLLFQDKEQALLDLTRESYFKCYKDENGPYSLTLQTQDNRLLLLIETALKTQLPMLVLSMKPYKKLVQDYFMIVESYRRAMADGKPSRIEAIDMGRRSIHNEGAELLQDRLSEKIDMDKETARRLFTLICVLHDGKALKWR